MGKCVVKDCSSRSDTCTKPKSITFHRIPKDPVRRDKWTKAIRLLRKETDWIPTQTSLICSKHFRVQDKSRHESDAGRVRLSRDAIPMLFDQLHSKEAEEPPRDMGVDWLDDVETDEEMQEITESPRKQKMRQTIEHLKRVSSRRLKKIKRLVVSNARLKKKNKKLIDVIEELKTKRVITEEDENAAKFE